MRRSDALLRLERLRNLFEFYEDDHLRSVLRGARERGWWRGFDYASTSSHDELMKILAWHEMTDDYDGEDVDFAPNHVSPLSGEWAGESMRELINSDVYEIDDEVLDIYEERYRMAYVAGLVFVARNYRESTRRGRIRKPSLPLFDPVPWEVCQDCVDFFHFDSVGVGEIRIREIEEAARRHRGSIELQFDEYGDTPIHFSKASCDFCDSPEAGQRFSTWFVCDRVTPLGDTRNVTKGDN